jgi:phage-related protein
MVDRDLEFWDDTGKAFLSIVRDWPDDVRKAVGADIRRAQRGQEPKNWKPLAGFPVACAEVRHDSGARVVYSVTYVEQSGRVYIADAFMKDSADGSAMRKKDRKRIEGRLKAYKLKYTQLKRRQMH